MTDIAAASSAPGRTISAKLLTLCFPLGNCPVTRAQATCRRLSMLRPGIAWSHVTTCTALPQHLRRRPTREEVPGKCHTGR